MPRHYHLWRMDTYGRRASKDPTVHASREQARRYGLKSSKKGGFFVRYCDDEKCHIDVLDERT